jgi:hypothetical protein
MPPKKQLYYAARCIGKERVGFFSTDSDERIAKKEIAAASVLGNPALSLRMLQRRSAKRDRKTKYRPKNDIEAQYLHMDGYLGIPVFYAHGMMKQYPLLKGVVSGTRREIPLFFNYEDLMEAWKKTHNGPSEEEPTVEVFNVWDVLTSIDKHFDRERKQLSQQPIQKQLAARVTKPFVKRYKAFTKPTPSALDIDCITFIPSSDATSYKEKITSQGNGKCRLRAMRKYN